MMLNDTLISLYQPRQMLRALQLLPAPLTFIQDTFFKERVGATAEAVEVDFYKGKRKLAPFVNMKVNGEVVERDSFVTDTYKPPLIAPEMIITVEDLQKRMAGETIYDGSASSGADRVNRRLGASQAKDLVEMRNSVTRRIEWMCSTLLCTGKIPIKGKGVDQELDLSRYWNYQDLTQDPKTNWDNLEVDIFAQIRKWKRKFVSQSGLTCDIMIFGSNALDRLYANKEWKEQQKYIQTKLGDYQPKIQSEGLMLVGVVLGVEIYTYEEEYLDDQDLDVLGQPKAKQMIDVNKVIISSTQVSNKIIFGLLYMVDGLGTTNIPLVPETFIDKKAKNLLQRLSSRPLPVPTNIDGFITATVCTGGDFLAAKSADGGNRESEADSANAPKKATK
ncbi:MAG: major capsid protein [Burkholderiales bacterium]|nr:major capsid protein [Burkholderiales bacterium]